MSNNWRKKIISVGVIIDMSKNLKFKIYVINPQGVSLGGITSNKVIWKSFLKLNSKTYLKNKHLKNLGNALPFRLIFRWLYLF